MQNEQMLFRFSHDLEPLEIKALDIFAARLAADVLSGVIGAYLALRTINGMIKKQKK